MKLLGALALFVCVALAMALARFGRRRHETAREEAEKAQAVALRKAVRAGTHDEHGHPLCVLCGDLATAYPYRFERDRSLVQWGRERIGAPPRQRLIADTDRDVRYCRCCVQLVEAEARVWIGERAQEQLRQIVRIETELQAFERGGLEEACRRKLGR